jgi:hypothetical protein
MLLKTLYRLTLALALSLSSLSALAEIVTYNFQGALGRLDTSNNSYFNDNGFYPGMDGFGSLTPGTPFTGSFTYDSNAGNYVWGSGTNNLISLSVTMDGNTVTTNQGFIYIANNYRYDNLSVYATNVSGSFGGVNLSQEYGLLVDLYETTGTLFNSNNLPGSELQTAYFTAGYLQLRSTYDSNFSSSASNGNIARGALAGLPITPSNIVPEQRVDAVPETDTSAMLLMGAGVMGFIARRRKNTQA